MTSPDRRLNAYRADLADIALKGEVEATRFVAGSPMRVVAGMAALRSAPSNDASLLTEALFGEDATVFDTTADGWAWVQLAQDRYVGWMRRTALSATEANATTHVVSALRTFAFAEPDIKSPPLFALPLGARVTVIGEAKDRNASYALIRPKGAVVTQHLKIAGEVEGDWTAVAERFLGVPYFWGGKTSLGIDCSGLVQVALGACGIVAARDSDMQASSVGRQLPLPTGTGGISRGDLVFWKGHVAIMRDAETLIHASAYHMAVAIEPLAAAAARFAALGLQPVAFRRPEKQ